MSQKNFCLKLSERELKELYLYLEFTRTHYDHPALDERFVIEVEHRIYELLEDCDLQERLAYTE